MHPRLPFPIGAFAFLFCLATAPCPSGHFRISRKARSPFHEILPVPARADIGASAFLFCLATGASLSSRFRQAVKAKYAFTVCLPALEGSHDASHAVVATRCRVLRLPSFTGTFRFSISVPFFLGVWLFGVV